MNGTFKNIQEARKFFKDDHFAAEAGVKIVSISNRECVCEMEIEQHHKNAAGNVMGGAIFTLADFTFAVLSNQIHKPTVAQNASINFLSSSKVGQLKAKATIIKSGITSTIADILITDTSNRKIAKGTITGFKL